MSISLFNVFNTGFFGGAGEIRPVYFRFVDLNDPRRMRVPCALSVSSLAQDSSGIDFWFGRDFGKVRRTIVSFQPSVDIINTPSWKYNQVL